MMHLSEVEVVVARLDVGEDAAHALAASLSDEERQRACRFRLAGDRRRYAVARGCLRQLLADRLRTHPRSVQLCRGVHGKPRLVPGSAAADWRFNVSHSGNLALLAFSRGREVGIDVEQVHALQGVDAISAQYFPPRELAAFLSLAPRDRALGFFGGWTRTEAIAKARGVGLQHAGARDEDAAWRVHSFSPAPGYVAALAVERS